MRSFLKKKTDFSYFPHQGPGQQPRFDLPPEETADLEELEEFSKMFKQKRIKLGKVVQCTMYITMWLNIQ